MASVFKRGGKNNRGGSYYLSWFDHTGRRRSKCAKTTDKAAAERIASKLEADAALRRDGVIDPTMDAIGRESQRPIDEHIRDYQAKLKAAGRTLGHIEGTICYIRKIAQAAQWQTAADILADAVHRFVGDLQEQGLSARTVQAYLAAVKAFSKWLAQNEKLQRDPLASVGKPDPKADRRHVRRMLLPDEWQRLRTTLVVGPDRHGISVVERLLLYWTAIQTGLRSGELRSLTRGNLFLDATQPYVTCKAGKTKNRKLAKQYIGHDLADALATHVATKSPSAPMFAMPHRFDVASMLRADLADARRQWFVEAKHDPAERLQREQSDFLTEENHDGQRLDFHALRHTCGAWLAMQGKHPKLIQTVMRHSTITLTMDTYGHLFPGQEAEAAIGMADLLAEQTMESDVALATGTDNRNVLLVDSTQEKAQRRAQQSGREVMLHDATARELLTSTTAQDKSRNPLQATALCDVEQHQAKRRARESNPQSLAGHLISSQAASQFAYPPCVAILTNPLGFTSSTRKRNLQARRASE